MISAKRPPLTSALADAKPSVVNAAVQLLAIHPASGIPGAAVLRLVQTAVGVKQLRMGLLSREGTPTHAPLGRARCLSARLSASVAEVSQD